MNTKTDDVSKEATPAAPAAEVAPAKTESVPSLLASGDASKAEGHSPSKTGVDALSVKADAAAASTTESKPDAVKPEGDKVSTESGEKPSPDGAEKGEAKPAEAKEIKAEEKAEAKPDPAKDKADGAKEPAKEAKEEPKEPQAPPAPPVYETYKVPETLKLDPARVGKFNTLLGETEIAGKADHASMQALGQQLVDFYAEEIATARQQMIDFQRTTWNRMKEGWQSELKADPDLGGNRIETTLGNAKYAFENFLGLDTDQQAKLLQILDNAGVSDHPVFIRGLNNLYGRLGPPTPVPPNLPSVKSKEAGSRGWYDTTDVKA